MRPASLAVGFAEVLRQRATELGAYSTEFSWPSSKYRADPVRFFREILGVEPWHRQIEIIEAIRDNDRVAVKSGHKISKSNTLAGIALWFYSSFDDARVVMTSTTARQVDQILWRELKMMHARCGRCVACKRANIAMLPCEHSHTIPEIPYELARSGLKSRDFREIVGFTAKEAEAVAGISGANVLYLPDEASGIPDEVFEAIEGNMAGGAKLCMAGNPTKTEGTFYEAFNSKKQFYKCLTVSSEEAAETGIRGLATKAWVAEMKLKWGEDSPFYIVRVTGEFAVGEDGKIFTIHRLLEATERWGETRGEGRLSLGLDPAGESGMRDESGFSLVRGKKNLRVLTKRGLTAEQHVIFALQILSEERQPGDDTPIIVLDREGPVGAKVYPAFVEWETKHKDDFEVFGFRASDAAYRQPQIYDTLRDELYANGALWVKDGGAVYPDEQMQKELHAPEWIQRADGKMKVTSKDELRKILGQSPDRGDAFLLSVWVPAAADTRKGRVQTTGVKAYHPAQQDGPLNPYRAAATWRKPQ